MKDWHKALLKEMNVCEKTSNLKYFKYQFFSLLFLYIYIYIYGKKIIILCLASWCSILNTLKILRIMQNCLKLVLKYLQLIPWFSH